MIKQKVIRKGKFDAGHRVMNERFQCFNVHGHEYQYELEYSYESMKDIGYAIDFKEIKRVVCAWIDENLDHAFIANPADKELIEVIKKLGSKLHVMSLCRDYCNPTAENIAKELFFIGSILLKHEPITLTKITLQETTNCFVECEGITKEEWDVLFASSLYDKVLEYKKLKGEVEYDDRKLSTHQ